MFFKLISSRSRIGVVKTTVRTFLSNEFRCTEAWNARLSPEFMKKKNLDTLYYDIEQNFQQQGKSSAVNIDIFVNKVNDDSFADEVSDLLHKLRLTEETTNSLQSTGHAVIRYYLELDKIEELLQILDDRLSYGVFLDHHSASYCMDKLIKKQDFKSAARIAVLMMLEEDFENELSRSLALYSCYRFLDNPEPFYNIVKEEDDGTPKEEIKVRVKFLRNEFFDDHFDLRNHNHLVGKTLSMIGTKLNGSVSESFQLLGHILYQKYDEAFKTIAIIHEGVYSEIIEKAKTFLSKDAENDPNNELIHQLQSALDSLLTLGKVKEGNLKSDLEKFLTEIVKNQEQNEIEKQEKIYENWCKLREEKHNDELKRLERIKRVENIAKLTEEMAKEEQKLWFFENEDKLELQIDAKKVYYPKRWFGKKKKPRVVDEGYIPPEIRQRK